MTPARHALVLVGVLLLGGGSAHAQGSFDRSTPRRTVGGFLEATRRGDDERAAEALSTAGTDDGHVHDLARDLGAVVERAVWLDLELISDDVATREGERLEIAVVPVESGSVPLVLRSERDGDELVWRFAPSVVWRIPDLARAHAPGWLERQVPSSLRGFGFGGFEPWQALGLLVLGLVSIVLGRAVAWVVLRIGARLAARTKTKWDDELLAALRGPTRVVLALVLGWTFLGTLALSAAVRGRIDRALSLVLIAGLAWLAQRLVVVIASQVERRARRRSSEEDLPEGQLRAVRTRVLLLRRIAAIAIGVVAVAAMLVQFEVVRTVGVSLLASAGIAGVVIGLAAQRSIGTLMAGVQLSVTQPFRIGDTVVVEGSWGTIEEINLTYVVVKIWDERRLVVPMSRFLESPFENWTKVSPELLGTVLVHADATVPLDRLRAELARIVEADPRWDRRVQSLVVTEAKERTVELRALVSAKNADDQWDLRCAVRERLVGWLATEDGGAYLPRARVEPVGRPNAGAR